MTEQEFHIECSKVVSNHVYLSLTRIIDYILGKSIDDIDAPISFEDIELKPSSDDPERSKVYPTMTWFEVWAVSSWLADKLYDEHELVSRGSPNLWFRQTSGQAICLDEVIRKITRDNIEAREPNAFSER